MPRPRDYELGELAVRHGLISRTQLDEAVGELTAHLEQSESPARDTQTILTVLIAKGYLKPSDISELLRQHESQDDVPAEVAQARQFADSRFGKYTIVRLLGTGGMGAVYQAWDNDLRRVVALKFLTVGTEDNIRRFIREAQTAARLNHPNIAQVHDVGAVESRHFITMEYVDGITLDMLPESVRRSEVDKIIRIMHDVALAVDYAHSKGIVHRDLKPQNIMIDDLLRPHIMDFGLARAVTTDELRQRQAPVRQITLTGIIIGTPNFIAPEQVRGENDRLDPRTDVYGLGATLFALLTGRPPFLGATPLDTLMDVLQCEPPRPMTLNTSVPRDVEAVVLRCLEKMPIHRYQTAREVAEELQRVLAGEPVRARAPSVTATVRRLVRKRPTSTAILISATLFVSLALWVASREMRRIAEEQATRMDFEARETQLKQRAVRRTEAQRLVEEARAGVERAQRMLLVGQFSRESLRRATDQAIATVTRAIEVDGSYAPAHLLRGQAHAVVGRHDPAIADFSRALQLDPESLPARQRRGLARLQRGLRNHRAPRMLTMLGSRASWNVLRPSPESTADFTGAADDLGSAAPLSQAARAMARGDAAAAASALSHAIELDPGNADAHFMLGAARLLTGDDAGAEAALDLALTHRPVFAEARAWRAIARLRQGRREPSAEDAQAGLSIEPDEPDLLLLAGRIDEAVRRNPKDPVALAWRGAERLRAGRAEEAIADFETALPLAREGAEVLLVLRAQAALLRGRDDAAESDGLEAVRVNPDYGPGHTALAAARWARGQRKPARDSLERALRLDPRDADAHELAGKMHEAEGRRDAAVEAWKRAVELDPSREPRIRPWIERDGR